jgi:hypothetical protein
MDDAGTLFGLLIRHLADAGVAEEVTDLVLARTRATINSAPCSPVNSATLIRAPANPGDLRTRSTWSP